MSVDLFIFRKNADITSAELHEACDQVALRFRYVRIDNTWDAKDGVSFPWSDIFFWSVCRGSIGLTVPGQAEDFEIEGVSQNSYAYAHINAKASSFNFILFVADALAEQMKADIFDPQDGTVLPTGLPPLEDLRQQHEADIRLFNPFLGREYRWRLLFDENAATAFDANAGRLNANLTASVKAVLDDAFTGLHITRFTSTDLPGALRLLVSFASDNDVTVSLAGDWAHREQFNRFAEDLSRRFGQEHRSRGRYIFR